MKQKWEFFSTRYAFGLNKFIGLGLGIRFYKYDKWTYEVIINVFVWTIYINTWRG